jgi:hypothetical protein
MVFYAVNFISNESCQFFPELLFGVGNDPAFIKSSDIKHKYVMLKFQTYFRQTHEPISVHAFHKLSDV